LYYNIFKILIIVLTIIIFIFIIFFTIIFFIYIYIFNHINFVGFCELNQFKIHSTDPSELILKVKLENEVNSIKFEPFNIRTIIKECDQNQIKFYDKSFFYCENPVCSSECPIENGHAECVKGENGSINSISLNECKCVPGWLDSETGERCVVKDYIDFSSL